MDPCHGLQTFTTLTWILMNPSPVTTFRLLSWPVKTLTVWLVTPRFKGLSLYTPMDIPGPKLLLIIICQNWLKVWLLTPHFERLGLTKQMNILKGSISYPEVSWRSPEASWRPSKATQKVRFESGQKCGLWHLIWQACKWTSLKAISVI